MIRLGSVSMSEQGAYPPYDDVRKILCTHLSHQDVVIDIVKRHGKVDKIQYAQTGRSQQR